MRVLTMKPTANEFKFVEVYLIAEVANQYQRGVPQNNILGHFQHRTEFLVKNISQNFMEIPNHIWSARLK